MTSSRAVPSPSGARPRTIAAGIAGGLAHHELAPRPRSRRRRRSSSRAARSRRGRARRAGRAAAASPATPIATSVVPCRHARPNESLTITATRRPVSSREPGAEPPRPRRPGRPGGARACSGAGAFDASTPADAQTKPWRVSAITSGGRDADDPRALAQDHLDLARVLVAGELDAPAPTARRRRAGRRGPRPSRRPSGRRRARRRPRACARAAAASSAPRSSPSARSPGSAARTRDRPAARLTAGR